MLIDNWKLFWINFNKHFFILFKKVSEKNLIKKYFSGLEMQAKLHVTMEEEQIQKHAKVPEHPLVLNSNSFKLFLSTLLT